MRNKGKIIERDGLFGDVVETVGSRLFNPTEGILWVTFYHRNILLKHNFRKEESVTLYSGK